MSSFNFGNTSLLGGPTNAAAKREFNNISLNHVLTFGIRLRAQFSELLLWSDQHASGDRLRCSSCRRSGIRNM